MLFHTQCGYSRSAVFMYATLTGRGFRCSGKVPQGFSRPIPGIRHHLTLSEIPRIAPPAIPINRVNLLYVINVGRIHRIDRTHGVGSINPDPA